MKRTRIWLFYLVIFGALLINVNPGIAQSTNNGWVGPYQISVRGHQTVGAGSLNGMDGVSITTDKNGIAHVFWREISEENRTLIQYAQFNGSNWTIPIDIFTTEPGQSIGYISAAVDNISGYLYLIWGTSAIAATLPVMMSRVLVTEAHIPQKWTEAINVGVDAYQVKLQIDSKGILHIVYSQFSDANPGVYYIYSEDNGGKWSFPLWLDPDILFGYSPRSLQFNLDNEDGLHVVWYYHSVNVTGDLVRYTHSIDIGSTWLDPITLDRIGNDPDKLLTFAGPVLETYEKTVLVIWAGGKSLNYRYFSYSTDRGVTWSQPAHIFGELNGQAGDGLVVDSTGKFHFFDQVRFPQGIWYSAWFEGRWTVPSLIYLIAQTSNTSKEGRLHAHDTHPAIVVGNVLLITFFDRLGDGGREPLYAMHMTMPDVPALDVLPLPEMTPAPTIEPVLGVTSPTPFTEAPTKFPDINTTLGPEFSRTNTPSSGVISGIIPAVLVVIGIIIVIFLSRRNG